MRAGLTLSWADESKRNNSPRERRAPRKASSLRERLLELLKTHAAGGQSLPLRSGNATTSRLTSPRCSEGPNGYLLSIPDRYRASHGFVRGLRRKKQKPVLSPESPTCGES